MEASPSDLFSDTEIDELSFINLDNEFTSESIWECFQEPHSSSSHASSSCFESPSPLSVEGPEKVPTVSNKTWNGSFTTPGILSFSRENSYQDSNGDLKTMEMLIDESEPKRPKIGSRSRCALLNLEHVIAERKRREKIAEKLIVLSAMIPGLKKRDKASILSDAINYMKEMQQKLKTLEDLQPTKQETVIDSPVSESMISVNNNNSNADGNNFPEIESRVCGNTVLIKIHCLRAAKGVLVKALTEIESLHLSVTNTNAIPFSDRFLDLTIMAEVEEGFSTVKDPFTKLRLAFRNLM